MMFRSLQSFQISLPACRSFFRYIPPLLLVTLLASGCTKPSEKPNKPSPEKMLEELSSSKNQPFNLSNSPLAASSVVSKGQQATETELPIPDDTPGALAKDPKPSREPDPQILGSDVVLKEKKLTPISIDDPSAEWSGELNLPYQVWEMTFVGNAPAGYSSRRVFAPTNRDKNLKIELESTVHVQRAGKLVRQRLEVKSTELTNGKLVSISGSLVSGDIKREFVAINSDDVLTIEATTDGAKSRTEIKLDDNVRGPFAVEQSLIRKPLKSGEIRSIRYFDPMIGKVVESQLEGLDFNKSSTMLGPSMELLEVSVSNRDGNQVGKSKLWMNRDGRVIKTSFPELNLRVFQVEEKLANEFSKTSDLQFVPSLTCPLELGSNGDTYTAALSQNDSIVYRLTHVTEDPTPIVSKKTNQRVRSVPTARTCDITLFRVDKNKDLPVGIEREINPSKAAKLTSDWCDTESSIAADFFDSFRSGLTEEATKDKFLTVEHFRQAIMQRYETIEFDREIRKLPQISRAKKLDGFEHALLFASMCRKSGIPARIAIGMVYNQDGSTPQMRLHGWVEYFVKDRWYPADSSQSSTKAELDRIKIRDSHADSDMFLEDVLYVANWMNNLKLRFVP
ncbi:MAG: transglutaminase-like domain-containing protein [Pirellula sp.]